MCLLSSHALLNDARRCAVSRDVGVTRWGASHATAAASRAPMSLGVSYTNGNKPI